MSRTFSIILRRKNQVDQYIGMGKYSFSFNDILTTTLENRQQFKTLKEANDVVSLMMTHHLNEMSEGRASELTDQTLYVAQINDTTLRVTVVYTVHCPVNRLLTAEKGE